MVYEIPAERGPVGRDCYLILRFDPRNAELSVPESLTYDLSHENHSAALNEAAAAAERAEIEGMPYHFVVIRAKAVATYAPGSEVEGMR